VSAATSLICTSHLADAFLDRLTSWGNEGSTCSQPDPSSSAWSAQPESQSTRKGSTATAAQSIQSQFTKESPEFEKLSKLYTDQFYPKPNLNPIPAFEVISVHEGLGSISICDGKPGAQVTYNPSARLGLFDKETGAVVTLFAERLVILNDPECSEMKIVDLEKSGAKTTYFFGNPFDHKYDGKSCLLKARWVGRLPPALPDEKSCPSCSSVLR
jgi:hypothetical protein